MAGPFDLAKFAPNPTTKFALRGGREYEIVADPEVNDMARMLRIESVLRGHDKEGDFSEALIEGKQILCELIRRVDPEADLDDFQINMRELLVLFTLTLRGQSVAEAVLEAISGGNPDEALQAVEDGSRNATDAPEGEGGGDVAPLGSPSAKRSPAPSSGSAEADDGLQATGTA